MATQLGMQFLYHPIPDHEVPRDVGPFARLWRTWRSGCAPASGLAMHCRGSIGRATLTAACTLVHLGWTPESALAAVETARGARCPTRKSRSEWILNYRAQA